MAWIKESLIFKPSGIFPWSLTHAQVPTALLMREHIRIYYATRDAEGRSLTSFINVSREDPSKVLYVHDQPILALGAPGTHDEDGVMVGSVISDNEMILLYYTGWSRGDTVPYRVSIGLAKSIDGGLTFERVFTGPIVDRTSLEPYMTMSPYVFREKNKWQMWYGSGIGWVSANGKMEPLYVVKYAESENGIKWTQNNILCIDQLHPLEANTRPSVLFTDSGYEMWFSYRHSLDFRDGTGAYRIGYATSKDGKNWYRHVDFSDLVPDSTGWNSCMMAYPNVLGLDDRRIMFYNGNGFGKTGFGYAVWENQIN